MAPAALPKPRSLVEPRDPFGEEREAFLVEGVDAGAASLLLVEQTGVFEDPQVTRGRRPLVLEALGDLARGRDATAEMKREQDLTPRRMREGGDDLIECFELLVRVQTGSTSQMVSSSSTGPMGSQTAMTSGVW